MRSDTRIARIALYIFFAAPIIPCWIVFLGRFGRLGNGGLAFASVWIVIGFIVAVILLVDKAFPAE